MATDPLRSRRAAARRPAPARRQVDLPPRGADRGDGRRGRRAIEGYLDAADTRSTLAAVEALGARGRGRRGRRPAPAICDRAASACAAPRPAAIDVGNAGTLLRLLPGWLAGQAGGALDARRRRLDPPPPGRPDRRAAAPDGRASSSCREDRLPPLRVEGAPLHGIEYELPVASAQVKSCLLFAGLLAEGETAVVEPLPSRDHTERMLRRRRRRGRAREDGAVAIAPGASGSSPARSSSPPTSPRPPSSSSPRCSSPAARSCSSGVGLNPTRTGLLAILERMGAEIEVEPEGERGGEPIGDLRVRPAPLRGDRGRRRRGPAGDRRAAAGRPRRLLRRGDDDDPRRRRAAPQGVRPDRDRDARR